MNNFNSSYKRHIELLSPMIGSNVQAALIEVKAMATDNHAMYALRFNGHDFIIDESSDCEILLSRYFGNKGLEKNICHDSIVDILEKRRDSIDTTSGGIYGVLFNSGKKDAYIELIKNLKEGF